MEGRPTVGVGMLSWRAPLTLAATLANYQQNRLLEQFDQVLLFCQDISDEDRAIAEEFGVPVDGNRANAGIIGGVRALLAGLKTDYVLLLENDCPLVESSAEVVRQLDGALADMVAYRIPVFRMRHLRVPGEDFNTLGKYLRLYGLRSSWLPTRVDERRWLRLLRRGLRPFKAARLRGIAAYAEIAPERRFPTVFQRTVHGNLLTDSRYLNWTNQSILVERHWMQTFLLPWVMAHPSRRTVGGFSDIEKELNHRWWRRQRVPIGLSVPGLFTHRRLDR